MGPTSCSVWVECRLTSYSMAYVVLPINAAGDRRGMHLHGCLRCRCRHSWMLMWHPLTWLTLSCPPPSLHPASSSSHLLLDLLFSCPVVVGVTSPIYRTRSIIGFDLVKNRTRCWGLLSQQTPCSIFVYSSPSVGQRQPCPSILLTMPSLVHPCRLVPSDHAVASPPYLLSRARSLNRDQHSWSRSIWMFTSYSITSGLNERSKTR